VVLAPHEGFGERDPEALIEVDRADLPSHVAEGDQFDADRDDGSGMVFLKVLEVRDDVVVLDTNHPLAGQKVRLRVHVRSVRPASTEEMEAAAEALTHAEADGEPGPAVRSDGPLLPVERLLKRGRENAAGPEGGNEPDPTPPHKRAVIV
jgi:FKBP-type peptidyl-prolyl cis-trans isomerase 2